MAKTKSSAYYQMQYRQRLRDQGLVKKEVWILPSRSQDLSEIEKILRDPILPIIDNTGTSVGKGEVMNTEIKYWTTAGLYEALQETELFKDGRVTMELIQGEEPCLLIIMREYGDLLLFLTVMRAYILVESLLWPVSEVKDSDAFNQEAMKSSKLFPLSYISIDTMHGDEDHYIMYGALSATSILRNVVFEIETLADNVIKATEAFEDHLKSSV